MEAGRFGDGKGKTNRDQQGASRWSAVTISGTPTKKLKTFPRRKSFRTLRLPLVGGAPFRHYDQKHLTQTGLLMEAATVRERACSNRIIPMQAIVSH
jgi:hypothetical protein